MSDGVFRRRFDVHRYRRQPMILTAAAAPGVAQGWIGLHHVECGIGDGGISVIPQTLHTVDEGIGL